MRLVTNAVRKFHLYNLDGFVWYDCWPEDWKEAVRVRLGMVKLLALREWGAALCYRCKHLTSGSVNTHCWRDCVVGVGEPRKECKNFEE